MKSKGEQQDCQQKSLRQYTLDNYHHWLAFIEKSDHDTENMKGPLLVYGHVMTNAWEIAVMKSREISCGISLSAGNEIAGGGFRFGERESFRMGTPIHKGPENPTDKFDQCVFVSYYQVKSRRFRAPKAIKARAGSSHPGDSDNLPPGGSHLVRSWESVEVSIVLIDRRYSFQKESMPMEFNQGTTMKQANLTNSL